MKIHINLSAINFDTNLGVWNFSKKLIGALSRFTNLKLIGIYQNTKPFPEYNYGLFKETIEENKYYNDGHGVELLLHHFQRPMTKLPSMVIFHDLHLWDVPWKYGKSELQLKMNIECLMKNVQAVVTEFPRTYFDLPRALPYVPNALFLTNSPTMIEFMEPDKSKIRAICRDLSIKRNDKVIIYPGQYQQHKNHINLFKAIKTINNKNIKLICPGSEFQESHTNLLKQAINELNLNNQIMLAGHLSAEEFSSLMHRSDLFVSASLAEGGAYIAQEAILYRKKIAISNIRPAIMHCKLMKSSIPYFDPLDVYNMGKVIKDVLGKPQDNLKAYNTISQWTWESLGKRYKDILVWIGDNCPKGKMPEFSSKEVGIALSGS